MRPPPENRETPVSGLQDLMRRKRWAEAQALCQREAESIAASVHGWAVEHVARCAGLPAEFQLNALAAPAAVAARLAVTRPGAELRSVGVVADGFIALACLVLELRDRATGETFTLFEKIYPENRREALQRELRLFRAIPPERLLAPRLVASHDLGRATAVLQEYGGGQALPAGSGQTLALIRKRHWAARLEGPMRLRIPDHGGTRFAVSALRRLARHAAEGSAARIEALVARTPQIVAALNAMPQFPFHRDLKPANVVHASPDAAPALEDLRVVDWEKWMATPIGTGLPLRAAALARPKNRAELARVHPLAALAAALYDANQRPPADPAQAAALVALALDAATALPT